MRRRRKQKVSVDQLIEEFFDSQLTEEDIMWDVGKSVRLVGGTTKFSVLAKGSRLDSITRYTTQLSNTPVQGSITPDTMLAPEPDDDD